MFVTFSLFLFSHWGKSLRHQRCTHACGHRWDYWRLTVNDIRFLPFWSADMSCITMRRTVEVWVFGRSSLSVGTLSLTWQTFVQSDDLHVWLIQTSRESGWDVPSTVNWKKAALICPVDHRPTKMQMPPARSAMIGIRLLVVHQQTN